MNVTVVLARLRSLLEAYLTSAGKQAARNLLWLVALTGLTQVASLGTVLLVTNCLGPAGFGVFVFALTLQSYLYLVGTLGTALVLFRDGINEPEGLDQITTAYQAVSLTGSMFVGGLTAGCAWLAPISGAEQRLICLIAAGNVAACFTLGPLFDVHHRQPLVAVVGLAAEGATLLAVYMLRRIGNLSLVSLGMVFAIKWWLIMISLCAMYHWTIRPLRLEFCAGQLRRMLHSSMPLACGALLAGLPVNAGVFFVRSLRGEFEAGVFGIAGQVAGAYLIFSNLAIRILQPHIAGRYGLDLFFVQKLIVFATVFLSLLYFVGLLAGAGVVLFILAPLYRPAITPMAVLLGAALLFSAGQIASSYLTVLHREHAVLVANSLAAVVYVVGAVALVPLRASLGCRYRHRPGRSLRDAVDDGGGTHESAGTGSSGTSEMIPVKRITNRSQFFAET